MSDKPNEEQQADEVEAPAPEAEEEATEDQIKPEPAAGQVWKGSGGNRIVTSVTPADNPEDEATVTYSTEASVDTPSEEKTVKLSAFQKWGKHMLGTIG